MSLVSICFISFIAVFVCLGLLAILMTVMVAIFPADSLESVVKERRLTPRDEGHIECDMVAAIHTVYRQIYPEAKIVSISEE
jgi:hypothetical protein